MATAAATVTNVVAIFAHQCVFVRDPDTQNMLFKLGYGAVSRVVCKVCKVLQRCSSHLLLLYPTDCRHEVNKSREKLQMAQHLPPRYCYWMKR